MVNAGNGKLLFLSLFCAGQSSLNCLRSRGSTVKMLAMWNHFKASMRGTRLAIISVHAKCQEEAELPRTSQGVRSPKT